MLQKNYILIITLIGIVLTSIENIIEKEVLLDINDRVKKYVSELSLHNIAISTFKDNPIFMSFVFLIRILLFSYVAWLMIQIHTYLQYFAGNNLILKILFLFLIIFSIFYLLPKFTVKIGTYIAATLWYLLIYSLLKILQTLVITFCRAPNGLLPIIGILLLIFTAFFI